MSLKVIAKNWVNNPILDELPTIENRDYLLEILPINVIPFELALKKIPYEYYWERVSLAR